MGVNTLFSSKKNEVLRLQKNKLTVCVNSVFRRKGQNKKNNIFFSALISCATLFFVAVKEEVLYAYTSDNRKYYPRENPHKLTAI
jgi:hypothetical protein